MICLSTGSLYTFGLARVFDLAAQVGFDGMEVLIDRRWDTRTPSYLRHLSREYGLPLVALHNPFDLDVPGWPFDQKERLARTASLARELEIPVVVAHLPFRFYALILQWHGPRHRRIMLPILWPRREAYFHLLRGEGLPQMEADLGVTIAVENMPDRRFFGLSLPFYWFNRLDLLGRFPHVTLDTTHLGTWGLDPVEAYRRLGTKVRHVHLSNYDGREHRSPPNGRLGLDTLLHALDGDGYSGAVSVECAPDALDADDVARCRTALKRAVAFCRAHYVGGRHPLLAKALGSGVQ